MTFETDPELQSLKKKMLDAQKAYYVRVHDLTQAQIKSCKHSYYYAGPSHNDDAYECSKCGNMEFR